MDVIIVSGLSGSGKSNCVNILEDIGYYCIDNIPAALMPPFAKLCAENGNIQHAAMVADARGGDFLSDINESLKSLEMSGIKYKILYFEASDETLERRFKETRRNHPLSDRILDIKKAVAEERRLLSPLRERADVIIDTTYLTVKQLRRRVTDLLTGDSRGSMKIHFMSFGFKYGVPSDADIIIDVRCLPNPFYDEALRPLTGKDRPVRDYVLNNAETQGFTKRFSALLDYMIPLYAQEGKSLLTVAVGCTGGKHRSVALADFFSEYVTEHYHKSTSGHRDINKI